MGYRPWGHKELDTPERLSLSCRPNAARERAPRGGPLLELAVVLNNSFLLPSSQSRPAVRQIHYPAIWAASSFSSFLSNDRQ